MSAAPVQADRLEHGVVLLRLCVPERRNAMTEELTAAWDRALRELQADPSVRCVAVTGEGPVFCAGGDLSWLEDSARMSTDRLRARMLPFYRTWLRIRDLEVPTVAILNGAAVGAGLALALACDLRYATPEAALSMPFTSLGIHAGMASTWLLPEVAGLAVAREMLLTGRVVRGADAVQLGLVNRLFGAETLREQALGVATTIATRAPIATRLTKAALAGGGPASIEAALQWESVAQPLTMVTADLREGVQAARERRSPVFTGE